jgi:hypothetical protein
VAGFLADQAHRRFVELTCHLNATVLDDSVRLAVLVAGLTWQAILMTLTRRGQPLVRAIKGLWTTALWGAVAAGAATLVVRAGDQYSCWVIVEGLQAGGDTSLANAGQCGPEVHEAIQKSPAVDRLNLVELVAAFFSPTASILLDFVVGFVVVIQIILLVFRIGALAILVGVSQLAAAGTVTRGTSPWVRKILAWMLAFIFYKPVAATVYAVGFMFLGTADGVEQGIIALAIIMLSLVSLPALMKFFNWPVGALESGAGSGLAGLGAAVLMSSALDKWPKKGSGGGGSSAGQFAVFVDSSQGAAAYAGGGPGPAGAVAAAGSSTTVAVVSRAGAASAGAGPMAFVPAVVLGAAGAVQGVDALKQKVVDHAEPDKD